MFCIIGLDWNPVFVEPLSNVFKIKLIEFCFQNRPIVALAKPFWRFLEPCFFYQNFAFVKAQIRIELKRAPFFALAYKHRYQTARTCSINSTASVNASFWWNKQKVRIEWGVSGKRLFHKFGGSEMRADLFQSGSRSGLGGWRPSNWGGPRNVFSHIFFNNKDFEKAWSWRGSFFALIKI